MTDAEESNKTILSSYLTPSSPFIPFNSTQNCKPLLFKTIKLNNRENKKPPNKGGF